MSPVDLALHEAYRSIAVHSRSFTLASRFLPKQVRHRAVVLYAWCRRADDAVDLASDQAPLRALRILQDEVDAIYRGQAMSDPLLDAFAQVIHSCHIPREYPDELLLGLEMDALDQRYETMEPLLQYCYRVAGTVGLMMCHVMGLREEWGVRNASHLGMAMQLTNICRDVREDWNAGRLYIPDSVLAAHGAVGLSERLGQDFPIDQRDAMRLSIEHLLMEADRYYQSGDAGLCTLSWQCALAIRTARRVYSSIGSRLAQLGHDPLAPRAVVSRGTKVRLTSSSVLVSVLELPARMRQGAVAGPERPVVPTRPIVFPEDVLPV